MEHNAKVRLSNKSQVVRLPRQFQLSVSEVFIHREGEKVILSPRPSSWDHYLAQGAIAPDDFLSETKDLPVQNR